jgi:hypothetical protein
MLSTGCGSDRPADLIPVVQREIVRPPPELLDCAAEPPIPPVTLDTEETDYLASALDAGADCRDRLARVKAWAAEAK